MKLDEVAQALTPEIHERFKEAVAIGKWPDGKTLTQEQKEICIQAIIAYEHKNLQVEDRTGYVPPKNSACAPDGNDDTVKWR